MNKRLLYFLIACGLLIMVTGVALAQTGGGYDLTWWTVDGGGASVAGGDYLLSGSAGQPDAATLTGGAYTLNGGFWGGIGGAAPPDPTPTPTPPPAGTQFIYLPLVIR